MQKYSASEVWQSSEVLWETFNVNYTKYSWLFNNFFVIFFGGWCLFFFLNVKQSKLSRIGMRRVKKNQESQKPWKILQLNHFHNGFDRTADHSCPFKKNVCVSMNLSWHVLCDNGIIHPFRQMNQEPTKRINFSF